MSNKNQMRLIPGHVVRLIFKLSPYKYYGNVKSWSGWFYFRRCWWVDISVLPSQVSIAAQHFSVSYDEIDNKKIRRLRLREKIQLMSLMLTIDEASQLTRISKESLRKAIIFGQIKSINFGGTDYIPRVELERVLNCIIDENKISCVCHPL